MTDSALGPDHDTSGQELPQIHYQDPYNSEQTIQGGLVLQTGDLALIEGPRKSDVVRRIKGSEFVLPEKADGPAESG